MRLASFLNSALAVALLAAPVQTGRAQARGEVSQHSMKGYELYSWKARGRWHFALLVGTNRLKTRREVDSPRVRVAGLGALKRKLSRLARGEEVTWTEGLVPGMSLPPDAVVEEVRSYCAARGIILRVGRRAPPPRALRSDRVLPSGKLGWEVAAEG